MEETEREEEAEAYKIVLKNCYFYHNSEPLPKKPWCLKTPNLASQLIQDLLEESKYDHKRFAKKCAKTLVDFKNMQLQEKIKQASLMRESVDIMKQMKNISKMLASVTSADIKVQKAQSTRGPIIIHVNANNNIERLEEGDKHTLVVDYLGFIELKFILDDEDSSYPEIGEYKVFFQQIIEETHYLKAMEKPELESTVCKKGKDYEIIIHFILKLSRENRLEILKSKYDLIEPILKNKSDTWITFLAFQDNLSIKFDESSEEFESLISESKARDTCCEGCIVL
ncbi:hypothetical protein SteCoe_14368 [Stentor coeruleus]|uniref:Uncharacterized protein n=1 Tax=Stentor coeruleus TaxID=5963 RepID=A0A1R2C420_9CILI|nr:hypothetical protein SteCoe_15328 [Stentor coeruleus]OMJ84483.1 hypothetical protein SteCoe_14368 [Stentor coeruleus]